MKFYCVDSCGGIKEEVHVFAHVFTSDKGGGTCFCPCSFVCLSVCLLARLLKNACMDLNEMLLSTDVGTWTNWLTFEPDLDYSPNAGTGLLSLISCKRCYAEFYVAKVPRIRNGGPALQRGVVLKWFYSQIRRITFVGGKFALPSALLVFFMILWFCALLFFYNWVNFMLPYFCLIQLSSCNSQWTCVWKVGYCGTDISLPWELAIRWISQ